MIDSFDGRVAGVDGGGSTGEAPRLHRADGGLGGTGPERVGEDVLGDGGGGRDVTSSAGAAQEFLSRLVSFVLAVGSLRYDIEPNS